MPYVCPIWHWRLRRRPSHRFRRLGLEGNGVGWRGSGADRGGSEVVSTWTSVVSSLPKVQTNTFLSMCSIDAPQILHTQSTWEPNFPAVPSNAIPPASPNPPSPNLRSQSTGKSPVPRSHPTPSPLCSLKVAPTSLYLGGLEKTHQRLSELEDEWKAIRHGDALGDCAGTQRCLNRGNCPFALSGAIRRNCTSFTPILPGCGSRRAHRCCRDDDSLDARLLLREGRRRRSMRVVDTVLNHPTPVVAFDGIIRASKWGSSQDCDVPDHLGCFVVVKETTIPFVFAWVRNYRISKQGGRDDWPGGCVRCWGWQERKGWRRLWRISLGPVEIISIQALLVTSATQRHRIWK